MSTKLYVGSGMGFSVSNGKNLLGYVDGRGVSGMVEVVGIGVSLVG